MSNQQMSSDAARIKSRAILFLYHVSNQGLEGSLCG